MPSCSIAVWKASLLLAMLFSAGCVVEEGGEGRDGEVGVSAQLILDGEPSRGDGHVVALLDEKGEPPFCSGTLVAPTAVLTAAHCVAYSQPVPRAVFFGDDVAHGGVVIDIDHAVMHPDYVDTDLAHDLALLWLAEASQAEPARLNTKTMDDSWLGTPVRLLGFGSTGAELDASYGRKLQRRVPLEAITTHRFQYPEATCHGDSGGPAFVDVNGRTVLLGVTSSGGFGCKDYGRSVRVDVHVAWIESELARDGALTKGDRGQAGGVAAESSSGCAVGARGDNRARRAHLGWVQLLLLAVMLVARWRAAYGDTGLRGRSSSR